MGAFEKAAQKTQASPKRKNRKWQKNGLRSSPLFSWWMSDIKRGYKRDFKEYEKIRGKIGENIGKTCGKMAMAKIDI